MARGVQAPQRGTLRDALNSGSGFTDELKRQAALRWFGDEAEAQRLREEQS